MTALAPTVLRSSALARARLEVARGDVGEPGMCLQRVRRFYGQEGGRDVVPARARTALEAWAAVSPVHRHTGTPPPGVPVFFGDTRPGHVALADDPGWIVSTDIRVLGRVSRVRTEVIAVRWGLRLRGWTSELNGVRVWVPPAPNPDADGVWVTVRRGDTVSGLTAHHTRRDHADWRVTWSHPRNADLRRDRGRPEQIQPGDRLWVP